MSEQVKTASGLAMQSHDEQQLELRARRVATAVASQMVDRYFDPERIEDMRDVRQQIARAAEHAAYEAILQERKLLANDMKLVRHWLDHRFADAMLNQQPPVIVPSEN